jgi:hypothetical protein
MSGSASSTAARKFLTKYLCRKFSYTLQEIFVIRILECHIIYTYCLQTKAICKSCAKIEVYHISACSTILSLSEIYSHHEQEISIFEFCCQEEKYIF